MSPPSDVEIAWLAGLLEGEGCFRVNKERRLDRPLARDAAVVQLKMTDKDVVDRALEVVTRIHPTKVTVQPEKPRNKTWSTAYKFKVNSHAAIAVMEAVYPYMGARRTVKIEEILARTDLTSSPSDQEGTVLER